MWKAMKTHWVATSVLIASLLGMWLMNNGYIFIASLVSAVASGIYLFIKYKPVSVPAVKSEPGAQGTWLGRVVGGIFVAIIVLLCMSFVYGVGLRDIHQVGGLPAMLSNPEVITTSVFSMVMTLLAAYCGFYLWYSSTKPKRWLYLTAMISAMLVVFGVTMSEKASRRPTFQSASEASEIGLWRWAEAKLTSAAWKINNWADTNMAFGRQYKIVVIPEMVNESGRVIDIPLYEGVIADSDGDGPEPKCLKLEGEPTPAKIGEEWMFYPKIRVLGESSDIFYIRLVNRWNENIIRFIRADWLDDVRQNQPKFRAKKKEKVKPETPPQPEAQMASFQPEQVKPEPTVAVRKYSGGAVDEVDPGEEVTLFASEQDLLLVHTGITQEYVGQKWDILAADGSYLSETDMDAIVVQVGVKPVMEVAVNYDGRLSEKEDRCYGVLEVKHAPRVPQPVSLGLKPGHPRDVKIRLVERRS